MYNYLAVYHCQQGVEKGLKGYLVFQDVVFQKTHNLSRLLALCTLKNSSFEQWQEMAELLTPYATEYRYPGAVLEPERLEAEQALEMAEAFVSFVLKVLPPELER